MKIIRPLKWTHISIWAAWLKYQWKGYNAIWQVTAKSINLPIVYKVYSEFARYNWIIVLEKHVHYININCAIEHWKLWISQSQLIIFIAMSYLSNLNVLKQWRSPRKVIHCKIPIINIFLPITCTETQLTSASVLRELILVYSVSTRNSKFS